MKKSRVWQAIVPGTQNKPQDTLQIRKTPWHGVTKQPPALNRMKNQGSGRQLFQARKTRRNSLLPSLCPGQTSLLNRMKKSRVWQAIVPGTQTKPQDTLQIRKTPWHGVTKQPPAVPLPGPNVTPEPNEKIRRLAGDCSRHTKQATRHPSNQENTLARRDETASCPEPNEKIKGLAGNCSRHTNQATRRPSNQENTLARPNETASCPEPSEKIKGLADNCSRHTNQATRHPSNQENTLARRDECPEPNEKIKGLAGNCSRHTKQATRHSSNQENTLARRNETASCRPLPGPNVTPEPKEKIKGLAGNCSRHAKQATRHPSNQENTLARRDETASCRHSARAKRHS